MEVIEYFAIPAEGEQSERNSRALAAANPERKMGKRKKISALKDIQNLNKEMDPTSRGLQCQTAPVPTQVLKLNEVYKKLFRRNYPRDYLHHVPVIIG